MTTETREISLADVLATIDRIDRETQLRASEPLAIATWWLPREHRTNPQTPDIR